MKSHSAFTAFTAFMLLAMVIPAQAQVVVLVHPSSGSLIISSNVAQPRLDAQRRAQAKGKGAGWKTLLASTVPGWGSMFCFKPKGGDVRYFIAEGMASGKEAVTEARRRAIVAASNTNSNVYICGSPWRNDNKYPLATSGALPKEPSKSLDDQVIEVIKQRVRKSVTCHPKKGKCPSEPKSTYTGVRG